MKKSLDYLAIPKSRGKIQKARKKRMIEEYHNRYIEKIILLKGKDSEEDILYLGKIVQKGDRVGFDTFPLHFNEYKAIIKKAQRDGKFPKGVQIENVAIPEDSHLKVYGELGYLEEKIKHRKLAYKKDRHEKILNFFKKIVHRIIRL